MANKAISAGTLANPVRLYNFLDAATSSLTTDPGLASLKQLGGLAKQLKDIGLDKIQFLSIPFETYEPDPNRLQLAPGADAIWDKLREDAAADPAAVARHHRRPPRTPTGPSGESTGEPGKPDKHDVADAEARAEAAAANGLCA